MKRFFALILTAVMLFAAASTSVAAVETSRLIGDVNGNGKIDATDYAMLKRAVLKTYDLNEIQTLAADVNGNGKIDAVDYAMVKRHVIGTYKISGEVKINDSPASEGLEYELNESGDGYFVTGIGSCTDTVLVIPSKHNDLPVIDIWDWAFAHCRNLTSVIIPIGVKNSSWGAFSGCTSLKSITLSNSVTIIGDNTFSDCTSLTNLTLPNSVTVIGIEAFGNCTSLKSITIPDGVKWFGAGAFDGCTGLTSIVIPDSVTSIGWNAFGGCTNLATVYYTGTEEQWKQIIIDDDNSCLTNATIVFNYKP